MSTRALAWIAITACTFILLCTGSVTALFGAGIGGGGNDIASASCYQPTTSASSTASSGAGTPDDHLPTVTGFSAEQVANAATIVAVGRQQQIPRRGWVIAVATAIQESALRSVAGGDRDSVGLFQQRPSQGWGTAAQLENPGYASAKFYTALTKVSGWEQMALTEAAQAVQRSAYPDAYAKHEPAATALVNALAGEDTSGCFATGEWTQPVNAPVGSGFRTADRPSHDGVDLIAPRGATIRAASAGKVIRVRCNAIDTRTGGEWGCDRDGSPELTRGCGWYVDIAHTGGIVTRYCHMGRPPAVTLGATVVAGQPLGVVGSTGHSSGPHLHFEVHTNSDESAVGAINPIPFMTGHGAPLGQK